MASVMTKKPFADLPPVDDDVDLSFAATTFSDDDSGDGFNDGDDGAKPSSPTEEVKRSPHSSSFQSLRSKPQPVAGSAVPKHVDTGRYRSGSQNSPTTACSLHSLSLHSQSSLSVASPISSLTPSLSSSSSSSLRTRSGSRSRTRPRSKSRPQEPDLKKMVAGSSTLVLKNLPFTLIPEDLEARLSSLSVNAAPIRVECKEKKGTGTFSGMAFAHYASVGSAKEAFGEMSHGFEVNGRKIKVEYKKGRKGSTDSEVGSISSSINVNSITTEAGAVAGSNGGGGGNGGGGNGNGNGSGGEGQRTGGGSGSGSGSEERSKSPDQANSSKITEHLQQFLECPESIFDFPSNCNSAMRKLIHASAKSLGLEHATTSCSNGQKFVRVYKTGAFDQRITGLDDEWALLPPTPPVGSNPAMLASAAANTTTNTTTTTTTTGGGGGGGGGGTPRSLLQTPLSSSSRSSSKSSSVHAVSAPGAGMSNSFRGGKSHRAMGAARNLNFGSRPHKHPAVSTGFRPRTAAARANNDGGNGGNGNGNGGNGGGGGSGGGNGGRERSNSGRGTPPFVLRQPKGPLSSGGRGFASFAGNRPRTKSVPTETGVSSLGANRSNTMGSPCSPLSSGEGVHVLRPKPVTASNILLNTPPPPPPTLVRTPPPPLGTAAGKPSRAVAAEAAPASAAAFVGAGSTASK